MQLLVLFPVADDNTTIINGRLFHTQVDEMGNPIIIDSAADGFGKLLDCFKDYENIMSVDEFNTYVSEIISDIKNYQEAISCLK